jgi:hypothetical protein
MHFLAINIDFTTINDDHLLLSVLLIVDYLLRFINTSYKFKSYLVLAINSEMSEEKDAFFNDLHIRL